MNIDKVNRLAIVIPAYKSTFLAAALESIAAQTCQDFTLYIGNDCSPNCLEEIVDKYRDKINLVYKRFDNNLGGTDLVAQWERCVDMTQGEEWLWLFSDDDIMEPGCVESFYKTIKKNPKSGLIHFNIKRLDDSTGKITKLPIFPESCSAKYYLDEKLKGHLISFVVEFVVRRDIFFDGGRFENFDLAWGSDFISWVKFADIAGGIDTCKNDCVIWRKSNENISPDKTSPILIRKINSLIENSRWLADFSKSKGYGNRLFYTKHPLGEILRNRKSFSSVQMVTLLNNYIKRVKPSGVIKFLLIILCRLIKF